MSELLATLLAFVGVMFVLGLAAQSVQEILKTMFVIKGFTRRKAIEGLVSEAVRYHGQFSIDARAIMDEILRRLAALGQNGVRKGRVRLDTLPADQLRDLIESVPPSVVPGLPVAEPEAKAVLQGIAAQAEKWYPLAMMPVDDRYRRRMRVLALVASALVVIPLNAGAGRVFQLSRSDREFRNSVAALQEQLRQQQASADTSNLPSALSLILRQRDSLTVWSAPTITDFASGDWWLGVALSVLLVSVGAPFWHDLLETIFGLKTRVAGPRQSDRSG
jgi:hypothetical protein